MVATEMGEILAVIPAKENRKTAREYGEHLDRERNLVE